MSLVVVHLQIQTLESTLAHECHDSDAHGHGHLHCKTELMQLEHHLFSLPADSKHLQNTEVDQEPDA